MQEVDHQSEQLDDKQSALSREPKTPASLASAKLFKKGEAGHLRAPIIEERDPNLGHRKSESVMATQGVS